MRQTTDSTQLVNSLGGWHPNGSSLDRLYVFFVANYFAQGMIGVAYEPLSYLLKDVLRLSAAGSAVFWAFASFPFLIKPLLGIVSDAVPLGGRRRIPYLLASSAATSAGWLALAVLPRYDYAKTLALLTSVHLGIAFSDVLCDAVMVQRGKELSKTGSYQAAQIGTMYATMVATGLGGGWLAEHASYQAVFALTAAFPLLILATTFLVAEEPSRGPKAAASDAFRSLASLALSPRFWAVCAVIFLYMFNPFQGTAFFYYQSEALRFSKTFIGALSTVDGLAGAAGAALFWRFYGRRDTAWIVRMSVLVGCPVTFLYLAYRGPVSAVLLRASLGLAGLFMRLGFMDLAAKACPEHGEATAFALFMSVFNLAAWASNTAGGALYARWVGGPLGPHGAMAALVAISAACTAACWPLLPRIEAPEPAPRALALEAP